MATTALNSKIGEAENKIPDTSEWFSDYYYSQYKT